VNNKFKLINSIIFILILSGCVTNDVKINNVFKKPINKQPILARNILDMPEDAYRVVLTISAQILNSDKKSKDVMLQSSCPIILRNSRLFSFQNAMLMSNEKINTDGRKNLEADTFFIDPLGRTLGYSISAVYSEDGKKIIVHNYSVVEKFVQAKNTVCFILPADEYNKLNQHTFPKTFYGLYRYAAINAITPQQASNYREKSKWAVMVFFLDRMSQSAISQLGISDKADPFDKGYTKDTKFIIYDGWRIGVAVGEFQLLQPGSTEPLYAKAFYSPGKEYTGNIFLKKSKMVSLYKIN